MMEDESIQHSELSDSQSMDESLEHIFSSMINHGQIYDALDFIRSIETDFLPSKTVMHTVIFKILMKSDDIKCLAFAYDYLMTVLSSFPPSDAKSGNFYYESVIDTHGFLSDLWNVFSHVVNSYFYHKEIYVIAKEGSDVIKYPNCKFLLEFYVKLFEVDFQCRCSEKFTHCLVVKLLWPKSETSGICLTHRTENLFRSINHIYDCGAGINAMGDLLGCMHDILTLVVKSFILGRSVCNYKVSANHLSDSSVFIHPALAEIVEALTNFCTNACSNLPNTKLFLNLLSLKYLQAKVSEKIIRQIIKLHSKRSYVLTLRDIVDQCMFPSKYNKWKNIKPSVNKEKNLRKRSDKSDKRTFIPDKKMETTKLHELCQKNKFADLCSRLRNSPSDDINARDSTGSTPLHLACQAGYHFCVQVLIDAASEGTQTLDYTAVNLESLTPLHLAVINNHVDIAKKLLDDGGAELLLTTDNKGQRPGDLCTSVPMNNVLQVYMAEVKDSIESDSVQVDSGTREAPSLKTFKENSIYLHALNCLLCTYCDLFNLVDFTWQKKTTVASHSDKKCCHFESKASVVCSEDAALISEMPDIIDTFIQSISKNVSKAENSINVDIELIPLKAFAASLKVE